MALIREYPPFFQGRFHRIHRAVEKHGDLLLIGLDQPWLYFKNILCPKGTGIQHDPCAPDFQFLQKGFHLFHGDAGKGHHRLVVHIHGSMDLFQDLRFRLKAGKADAGLRITGTVNGQVLPDATLLLKKDAVQTAFPQRLLEITAVLGAKQDHRLVFHAVIVQRPADVYALSACFPGSASFSASASSRRYS